LRIVRYFSLTVLAICLLCVALPGQDLVVWRSGDQIRVAAPRLHVLTGKPLDRLKNGNQVAFDFHLSVLGEGRTTVLRRAFERFAISYDLWEEKFSVAGVRTSKADASRLTAAAAEAWCLDNVGVPLAGLPGDKPVHVELDIRAQDSKDEPPLIGDTGVSLSSLIEIFSRGGKTQQPAQWRLIAGPVRLADLDAQPRRGAN